MGNYGYVASARQWRARRLGTHGGGEGRGHIVSPRAQLVIREMLMSYGLLIQAAGFALPTVAEMRRHIGHYVSTQLFAGKELPPAADRRFFPTSIDFTTASTEPV